MKKIVTIGGGNGQPVMLRALRDIPDIDIKAIVTTLDDGGSTGRLCDELGIMPPADTMKCLLGLSKYDLEEFFTKRFSRPEKIKGHSVGNMLLTMLMGYTGSFERGIEALADALEVRGKVLPVILGKRKLVARYSDGKIIKGENAIDEPCDHDPGSFITDLLVEPDGPANPEAVQAIKEADFIIFGPGDFYTSILANVAVAEIAEAIKNSPAKLFYVANLMTKHGQIHDQGVKELLAEMEKYTHRAIDYLLINNAKIDQSIIDHYKEHNEKPISDNIKSFPGQIIRADIIENSLIKKDKHDILLRSALKHSPEKLKAIIQKIITKP